MAVGAASEGSDISIKILPNDKAGKGINSLNKEQINYSSLDNIMTLLGSLDYGTRDGEFYDCEDRAFWGIAHVRHWFPGVPVGLAAGDVHLGGALEGAHACIVVWYLEGNETKHTYFDQERRQEIKEEFGKSDKDLVLVIGFPAENSGQGFRPDPMIDKHRIFEKNIVILDRTHKFYPKADIINYLSQKDYDAKCLDAKGQPYHGTSSKFSFEKYWKKTPEDKALWAMVHLRRKFYGAPVGVAMGKDKAALMIIYKEGNEEQVTYWDLEGDGKEIGNFDADLIVM